MGVAPRSLRTCFRVAASMSAAHAEKYLRIIRSHHSDDLRRDLHLDSRAVRVALRALWMYFRLARGGEGSRCEPSGIEAAQLP